LLTTLTCLFIVQNVIFLHSLDKFLIFTVILCHWSITQ